ncbi:MAG: Crp/Fnr family transcriptional regulator [Gammaproteobacteria bacterium]
MRVEDRKLLELFEQLAPEQQERLIAFAEFLSSGAAESGTAEREPAAMARPENETVTMAIRRLTRAYPMLDRRKLMVEASEFMAQHALQGRPAREVIDDLEVLFVRHHEQHKSKVESRESEG